MCVKMIWAESCKFSNLVSVITKHSKKSFFVVIFRYVSKIIKFTFIRSKKSLSLIQAVILIIWLVRYLIWCLYFFMRFNFYVFEWDLQTKIHIKIDHLKWRFLEISVRQTFLVWIDNIWIIMQWKSNRHISVQNCI